MDPQRVQDLINFVFGLFEMKKKYIFMKSNYYVSKEFFFFFFLILGCRRGSSDFISFINFFFYVFKNIKLNLKQSQFPLTKKKMNGGKPEKKQNISSKK